MNFTPVIQTFKTQRLLHIVLLVVFGVLLIDLLPAFAAECQTDPITLEVGIGTDYISYGLTDYIAKAYKFGVGTVAILSAVMIMINGLKWVGATGNAAGINEAKQGVLSALIGLVIAIGSYALLFAINSNLVNLPAICPTGLHFDPQGVWAGCSVETGSNSSECTGIDYCKHGSNGCACTGIDGSFVCTPADAHVVPQGQRCQNTDDCEKPLQCIGASDRAPGTCTDTAEGAACKTNKDCQSGMECVTYKEIGKCYPPTGRTNGAYCTASSQCASKICSTRYYENKCVAGDGSDGAICHKDSDLCKQGYECTGDLASCTQMVVNSECGGGARDCIPEGSTTILYCVDNTEETFDFGYSCQDGSKDAYCDVYWHCKSEACQNGRCL